MDTGETNPLAKDTDKDGLDDGVEDKNKNGIVDTGETDPTLWDTDKGGESDGSEVKNKRNPLNPKDDFGGPDSGPPIKDMGVDMAADMGVDMGADMGADMTADMGADMAADMGVDMAADMGVDTAQDAGVPDTTAPDQMVVAKEAGIKPDSGDEIFLFGGGGCSVGTGSSGGLLLGLMLLGLAVLRRGRSG